MKKAKYICFEGTEGTGKTTQLSIIAEALRNKGFRVLETKEPGTNLSPLTMEMRKLVLDKKYDPEMTVEAREYLLQAIRSVHIGYVINNALTEYDYILQDRGQLSGLAYGEGCGVNAADMESLLKITLKDKKVEDLYDLVIIFKGDVHKGLNRAMSSKQEFAGGDALEAKGGSFMSKVDQQFDKLCARFNNVEKVQVDDKSIEEITKELLQIIEKL